MQLTELTIKQALLIKKVSAKQMCKDINLSEPSLYRFYQSGNMRKSTESKIREYLSIDSMELPKKQVSLSYDSVDYWKGLYEEERRKVSTLVNTIQSLSLGKFKPVFSKPANVSGNHFFYGY